jgi:hypothetical protein
MKRAPDGFRPGSARASRAGPWSEEDFGGGTAISTRDAYVLQGFRFAARSTRAT